MRHRQTTGAGPSGARPSLVVLLLTAAGGGLTASLGQPAGVWAGYGAATVAALVGCGTLWQQQRGLPDRHAEEIVQSQRAGLDEAAVAADEQRAELERVRTELEHERQYSILIQDQLSRARELLERERTARRTAERELDALTGASGWPTRKPSVKLTLEQQVSGREAAPTGQQSGVPVVQAPVEEPQTAAWSGVGGPAVAEPIAPPLPGTTLSESTLSESTLFESPLPEPTRSAAQRRGWQVVDGDSEDEADSLAAETDRLYRPFIDHLAAAAVPVSDAALAMAPVIGTVDSDDILDLTAYDETVEFSVREIRRMA
jgi:hypothetical protein